jgi:hypothetical protein
VCLFISPSFINSVDDQIQGMGSIWKSNGDWYEVRGVMGLQMRRSINGLQMRRSINVIGV